MFLVIFTCIVLLAMERNAMSLPVASHEAVNAGEETAGGEAANIGRCLFLAENVAQDIAISSPSTFLTNIMRSVRGVHRKDMPSRAFQHHQWFGAMGAVSEQVRSSFDLVPPTRAVLSKSHRTLFLRPRFLLAMCSGGQLSNRLICLRRTLLDGAMLGRKVILPTTGIDFNYDHLFM